MEALIAYSEALLREEFRAPPGRRRYECTAWIDRDPGAESDEPVTGADDADDRRRPRVYDFSALGAGGEGRDQRAALDDRLGRGRHDERRSSPGSR